MSAGDTITHTPENGNGGNNRTPCPFHGCRRVYSDSGALQSHIKDHEISAQSLPGKVLQCSTIGCSASLPDMQKLMEHMRHHHKPNIFFLCESCRTKLRSYRGLLTHLHTCSKVPRGKTKPAEQPAAGAPMAVDQNPPQLDSASSPQQAPPQIPIPDGSFPAAVPQLVPAAPPALCPPFSFNSETPPPQLAPQPRSSPSDLPPPLSLDVPAAAAAAPDPPDAQGQQQTQTRSPEPARPALGSAPRSPPGSSAVWKKNQGLGCIRRILWEHTKGRYMCVQCGHAVTNRKEMTHHINSRHSGNKPGEDAGGSATGT